MRQRVSDRVPALELEGSGAQIGACGQFAWTTEGRMQARRWQMVVVRRVAAVYMRSQDN